MLKSKRVGRKEKLFIFTSNIFRKNYRVHVGRDNGIFYTFFLIKIKVKFTDIWKHLHVIELHAVLFTIIETTSR